MEIKYEWNEAFIPINIFGIQKKYIEHQFKNLGIDVFLSKRVKIQNKYAYMTKVTDEQWQKISKVYRVTIECGDDDMGRINIFPK